MRGFQSTGAQAHREPRPMGAIGTGPRAGTRRRQAGVSAGGWFVIIIVVMSVASIGLQLIPHYLDHGTVDGVIQNQMTAGNLGDLNEVEFAAVVERQLKLNNVREFKPEDKITFENLDGAVKVSLVYEVRTHLFSNVDVVLSFEEHYEKVL